VDEDEQEPVDDRAPICPSCGVTMLIADDGTGEYTCLECGFSDDSPAPV
jgi:ribosomal protein S27AE